MNEDEPDSTKNIVILYHADCPDGFGSAFAFWKKYGDEAEYIPVFHGKPYPNNLDGKEVYIADFSYSRDTILEIKSKVKSLKILDHHATAQDRLCGLDFCHFDMNHSGSVLSWEYCFNEEAPLLLKYIEDRDLWRFLLPHSEEILSVVDSYPYDFKVWDKLAKEIQGKKFKQIIREGKTIIRYKESLINKILQYKYETIIDGHLVPIVNTPVFQSEIGHILDKEAGIASAFFYDGEKYVFSLRSPEDGKDVSVIATNHGGGGHKHSAGFGTKDLEIVHGLKKQN